MNNNLLELGGYVNVIATAICDFSVSSNNYHKGDVVLNLESVYCNLQYTNQNTNLRSDKTKLSYSEYHLSSFNLSYVPFNRQVSNLFASCDDEDEELVFTSSCACFAHIMFLNDKPIKESIRIPGIESFTVEDDELGVRLISEEFENQNYIVYYKKKVKGINFILDNSDSSIPYLKIQIEIKGNKDKENTQGYLLLDKVKLNYTPVTNFGNDNVTYCNLSGIVIDDIKKPKLLIQSE